MAGKCPKELEAQFAEDCLAGNSVAELCTKYGKAQSTIKDWRMDLRRQGVLPWVENYRCEVYNKQITLDGDAVIIGDLEVPYHDGELLSRVVAIARKFKIKTLVIAGDFLANDAKSSWGHEDTDHSGVFTIQMSLQAGRKVLGELFEWFDHIAIIKGNHEQRANRDAELGFFEMMRDSWEDLGELELSFYKWMDIKTNEGVKRIEHPQNYAKQPGSLARDRAEIEDMDVVEAHTHHQSWSVTKNGKFQAIDLGHCTRPETRYYKQVNGTSRHPRWAAGFWVLRNGFFYRFSKEFTDWSFWLKEIKMKKGKKNEEV